MWRQLLLFSCLTQHNLISSNPVVDQKTDNVRTPRQSNFGDCCPCPSKDAFQDQDLAANSVVASADEDSCPCRPSSDSEGASSMFSPAFRAVEPFVRSVSKKQEPKPLLNPEVGLASSVLETLREVTDQEYREALERDSARNTLKFMTQNSELLQTEPRNVVDVIFNPKEENNDDTISDASEIQENSCVLPPLGNNNNVENLRLQSPIKLLKQILTSPKLINNGNVDMAGSASNIQEGLLQPLQSNIVENMRKKSNLLNLRPFSNRDFLTSPNILQKYYLKNNIGNQKLSRNVPLVEEQQPKTPSNFRVLIAKNAATNKELINTEPDKVHDFKQDVSFGKNDRKLDGTLEDNILQNTDCTEIVAESNIGHDEENLEDFDVVTSSSKIIELKKSNVTEERNGIQQDKDAGVFNDKILKTDTQMTNNLNPKTLQNVSERNDFFNCKKLESDAMAKITKENEEVDDIAIENSTEYLDKMKDMQTEPGMATDIIRKFQDPAKHFTSSKENKRKANSPSMDSKERLLLRSVEKDMVGSNVDSLPNINTDVFRTLESFKTTNQNIQEKLRSNAQDVLPSVISNEPVYSSSQTHTEPNSDMHTSSVAEKEIIDYVTPTNNGKSMSNQDLQRMSDTLLELSSKDKVEVENKSSELNEQFDSDDMITSPTSLNEKTNAINLTDIISNEHFKDQQINKTIESRENLCSNNVAIKKPGYSNTYNEGKEMSAQPSNSVFKSVSHATPTNSELLQRDLVVQPEETIRPLESIKDFFNKFRPLRTDIFTNNDKISELFANQPLYGLNTRNYTPKLNSDSTLNSYTAKVASPKSIDFKSLLPTRSYEDNKADLFGFESQKIPHITNLKNVFRNDRDNGLNPLFKTLHIPQMLQDTFSSLAPNLPMGFKPLTNNALKTEQNPLSVVERKSFLTNDNNLLAKPLIKPDILYETLVKTHEDFNDKFQNFHSDLNSRLSSISSKLSPEGSGLLWNPSKLKTNKSSDKLNNLSSKYVGTIPVKTKSDSNKKLLTKNNPTIESISRKTTDILPRIIRPKKEKYQIDSVPHQTDTGYKKRPIAISPPKTYHTTKKPPKNKVTISFATTSPRPETLKSMFKPLNQKDSLKPRTINASMKLPKLPKIDGKPILKSKLESMEPRVLASDISTSRATLPNTITKKKMTENISSLEELGGTNDENKNSNNRHHADISEIQEKKSLLLSKIKNALGNRVSNHDIKKNNKQLPIRQSENEFDASQSASNNIDTSISGASLLGETYKENGQSFKCKMVCIKDILDSRDTYNKS